MNYLNVFTAVYNLCANWQRLVLHRLFGWPIKSVVLRSGTVFMVPDGKLGRADLSMLAEIWFNEYYNPPFFSIGPEDVVVDVGANNGYFSVYAARRAQRVVAFEPVPRLAEIIKANAAANNLTNVSVEPLAIAGKNGSHDFFVSATHNGCHSLFKRDAGDAATTVKTETLESYCERQGIGRIHFLKLDCEGAEYDILLTMSHGMLGRIDKIAMEYHDDINEHRHGELVEFLASHGFYVSVKGGYLYALSSARLPLSHRGNIL